MKQETHIKTIAYPDSTGFVHALKEALDAGWEIINSGQSISDSEYHSRSSWWAILRKG